MLPIPGSDICSCRRPLRAVHSVSDGTSRTTRVRGLSYMLVDHGPTTQPGSASCQDKCCRTTGAVSFLKSGSPAVLVAAIAVAFAVAPTAMCAVAAATDLD